MMWHDVSYMYVRLSMTMHTDTPMLNRYSVLYYTYCADGATHLLTDRSQQHVEIDHPVVHT